ncbi:DUF1365-domain-containing protein [Teratosphaeria nubilosa]|uniref:DUF1365-domain-containing protein n=1 Tax=Teratosphaeria nubilosa TaxID=161662 RepID=A0A6G1KY91_9PEZI|nr:DUF1365-domain-containing protein [Teratosphaeria nubilosa]
MVSQDSTWVEDLLLFLGVHAIYTYGTGASGLPSWDDLYWLVLDETTIPLYLQVFSLLGVCGCFAGGIVSRGHHLKVKEQEPLPQQRIDEQVLPPLLLTSRTTHSRLFPKKHAFSYSYLLVGVPVGIQGRISKVLSVDSQRPGWFNVDSEDYLERGYSHFTLAEKLKRYLHSQGVTDQDHAFAWLVTAPRLLGYSFNPVSFWYLYDSDTKLKYMILEVNNTFGERRMYLLRGGDMDAEDAELAEANGSKSAAKQIVFADTWKKDFHVSPFNSRKGSYSLRATDPLAEYEETGQVRIDNTIVMRSSKEHPKIVARIYSEGTPKDPTRISSLQAVRFILVWCWVGFATFPRIIWEATKLFFKRKLHVWYRPEVTATSIGRTYTEDERHLEAFFRAFLSNAVNEGSKPLRVIYEPAHNENTEVVLYSPAFTYEEDHKRTLIIKVLSPAFYSRFVHYQHAKDAFDHECLVQDERNRTATVERQELLSVLYGAFEDQQRIRLPSTIRQSAPEQIRWACMRQLRCPPAAISYSTSDTRPLKPAVTSAPSELDHFVLSQCSDAAIYRRITCKLFLAERFAFGLPVVLVAMDWLFRSCLILASLLYTDNDEHAVDVFRPRRLGREDIAGFAVTVLLANGLHVWSWVKG